MEGCDMADFSVKPLETLCTAGFFAYLHGFSAVDSWLGRETGAAVQVLTNADAADLARLFADLRYPGMDIADAALDDTKKVCYFHCADMREFAFEENSPSFNLLEFYQEYKSRAFYDPCGIYPLLTGIRRGIRKSAAAHSAKETHVKTDANADAFENVFEILGGGLDPCSERSRAVMDAALILAKYFPTDSVPNGGAGEQIKKIAELFGGLRKGPDPGQEEQRLLLCELMTSPNPGLGLDLLKACGFIGELWPELAILEHTDHSKEFHPEGNAWTHTMETFHYRKTCDLRLSLGLLLHDTGKPVAVAAGSRRFNGHAELGEIEARRFLERLKFGASLTDDVCFLVRNHMLPAALPRLPLFRTEEVMSSHLFPVLLELYRCDESSSFKGPDGYYESSAAYQSYLRNRRNPYRSADGKKLNRNGAAIVR
ncbi:MAG: HD domain-containing protein [Treponema sp.]|jgi:poly(A) polymerase|nr:HD domain-containing protein [Treponema sp.]